MTKESLQQIKARCDKATPGPWTTERPPGETHGFKHGTVVAMVSRNQIVWANPTGGSYPSSDQEFIAHARQDIPALLTLVEQQQAEIEKLNAWRERDRSNLHTKSDMVLESKDITPTLWVRIEQLEKEITRLKAVVEKAKEGLESIRNLKAQGYGDHWCHDWALDPETVRDIATETLATITDLEGKGE